MFEYILGHHREICRNIWRMERRKEGTLEWMGLGWGGERKREVEGVDKEKER